jgi:hypothetical protein
MSERWIAYLLLAEILSSLVEAWLISAAAIVRIGITSPAGNTGQ